MKRILIVDDYKDMRGILRSLLESEGYACQEVEHGAEALAHLQAEHFDLVITDNEMPVMSGIQLLQSLSENLGKQPPPVVLLSGRLTKEVRHTALRAGASSVFKKPCNVQQILLEVAKILDQRETLKD